MKSHYSNHFEFFCVGNPLEAKHSEEGDWREQATKKLPKLKKLDGKSLDSIHNMS